MAVKSSINKKIFKNSSGQLVKIIGCLFFVLAILSQAALLDAFEAHIINVTAEIVNDIPSADPPGGNFSFCENEIPVVKVTLNTSLAGAKIVYTTGGGPDPDCGINAQYDSPYETDLNQSGLLKARTCHDGMQSAIASWDFQISTQTCEQPPVCGNGTVETGETCDDGNATDGDGCSGVCQNENQSSVCGNGTVESGEQCDDGNTTDGDGCSANCQTEGALACVKINEVYYNVDSEHGSDGGDSQSDEWVELYNVCDYDVNLKDWSLQDNHQTSSVSHSNKTLSSHQFAVIAKAAQTWIYWPLVPAEALEIEIGQNIGDGLANTGDRVFLLDDTGFVIDKVSWGSDISAFSPSVLPVAPDGESIARNSLGVDTDTAADWVILDTPNPGN